MMIRHIESTIKNAKPNVIDQIYDHMKKNDLIDKNDWFEQCGGEKLIFSHPIIYL